MTLPTAKQKKSTNPFDYTILIYGDPKIGKSEACSRIPDALFIQTEPGIKNLEVFTTPLIETWEEFLDVAKDMSEGKHSFKTIVVDTLDGMYQLCARYICKQNGWKHESELDYGRGYTRVKLELMRVLNKLAGLPTGLVLVGHAKEKEVKTRTGTFDRITLCFSSSIEEAITAFVDVALYARVETHEGEKIRVVRSLYSDDYFAGGRIDFFEDGMLLEDLFNETSKNGGSK